MLLLTSVAALLLLGKHTVRESMKLHFNSTLILVVKA